MTTRQIPFVDYLELGPPPRLVASECTSCAARYFDRRNACANCGGRDFHPAPVATTGEVRSFTIVTFAAPGVPVPFVAAVVDCEGTSVRTNLVGVDASPDAVHLGMKVALTTYVAGTDAEGVEAVNYAFTPLGRAEQ
ncbi:Zn-ribbon domain-containing OB-fold protein [Cryptosporangium arvum]|uniref:Zn-ribbon domain-containing OB-fold protein n=1 Tax=Cryptosporangium arvum TaxID=80871 RepID=UPI0004B8F8F5|nr:OB-fold domain-containing protein [Cryptosporangium arvum]